MFIYILTWIGLRNKSVKYWHEVTGNPQLSNEEPTRRCHRRSLLRWPYALLYNDENAGVHMSTIL